MRIGEGDMKILKIENGKGYFFNSKSSAWKQIDEIDKEALLNLLEIFVAEEVEIDEFQDTLIQNQAQEIIYRNIHQKFEELKKNKNMFKDEADRMYLEEIQKYQQL